MSTAPPSNPPLQRDKPLLAACIATTLIMLTGCAIFLWGADKGFDITDEGLYLLVYQNPDEFRDAWTSYHRIGALVFPLLGHNIIALRLAGFLSLSLATLVFSTAFLSFLHNRGTGFFDTPTERWCFHSTIQTSVLAAYCWLPPTPNYNTMAGIGILCAAAGVLSLLAHPDNRNTPARLATACLGLGFGLILTLLAKGSSAVAFVALAFVLLLASNLLPWKKRIIIVVASLFSLVVLGALIFAFFPDLLVTVRFMLGSLVAIFSGQGASGIVSRHLEESVEFATRNWKSYHIPILLALSVGLSSRILPSQRTKILVWGVPACIAGLFFYAFDKNAFLAGIEHRSGSMLGYSSCLLVLATLRTSIRGAKDTLKASLLSTATIAALLLWLSILPFLTAAGTTHRIYINSLLHTAPLLAAILVIAIWLDRSMPRKIVTPLTSAFLAALAFSQFLTGFFLDPYRIPAKYLQTQPTEIGVPATTLKVDPQTSLLIAQTKQALESAGFTPGDDILALYGLPGLVYAVGGISPQKPWYFFDHGERGDRENMLALQSIPHERLRKAFVILADHDKRASEQLARLQVSFPGDYLALGDAYWAFRDQKISIWRAR